MDPDFYLKSFSFCERWLSKFLIVWLTINLFNFWRYKKVFTFPFFFLFFFAEYEILSHFMTFSGLLRLNGKMLSFFICLQIICLSNSGYLLFLLLSNVILVISCNILHFCFILSAWSFFSFLNICVYTFQQIS